MTGEHGGRPLRHTVVVLNRRFLPRGPSAPHLYGVVQHALHTAAVLRAEGARVGFVLYERDEGLDRPELLAERVHGGFPAVAVRFHFGMDRGSLTEAFRRAVRGVRAAWGGGAEPVVYFQTSALLPFAPGEFDTVVTHHSPFVSGVTRAIGGPATRRAFDWDHPKTDHLAAAQRAGIEVCARRARVRCAEISPIQVAHLRAHGVPADRVTALPQPLGDTDGATGELPPALAGFTAGAGLGPLAVTAVSRLDHFKNVDLFVEGCVRAVADGALRAAAVVGGEPRDAARDRLRALVPRRLRDAVLFHPKIAHSALVGGLFPALAGRGVFVCSSRFDLVPYTALQSARAGLCTLAPDTDTVGAATYLPRRYRYVPTPEGLAGRLAALGPEGVSPAGFGETAAAVHEATGDKKFLDAFVEVCAGFSAG